MHVLNVVDVNEALPLGLAYLRDCGRVQQTRNGPAMVAPGPVATVYKRPDQRVLFDAERDANPFFHLFESLWILAGRQDVGFLSLFNKKIADYSDDGKTFHAPYGYRLRKFFGFDQIGRACEILKQSPESRRVVLQIWDAEIDLGAIGKDLPCNDLIMVSISNSALDITVCNRSNDAIWGAYGANAVQFSMIQEYMAAKIGVGVGTYTQMSNNFHAYTDNSYWQKFIAGQVGDWNPHTPYDLGARSDAFCTPYAIADASNFDADLVEFFHHYDWKHEDQPYWITCEGEFPYASVYFRRVVIPMLEAYLDRSKVARLDSSIDWHLAGAQWVARREAAKLEKKQ